MSKWTWDTLARSACLWKRRAGYGLLFICSLFIPKVKVGRYEIGLCRGHWVQRLADLFTKRRGGFRPYARSLPRIYRLSIMYLCAVTFLETVYFCAYWTTLKFSHSRSPFLYDTEIIGARKRLLLYNSFKKISYYHHVMRYNKSLNVVLLYCCQQ